ncbi:MAG: NfeD family protein [Clostridiales bacterium]|nr:NfeD family protein [Clostridiales bacterium]
MSILWVVLLLLFAAMEAFTVQLVSVWFAFGALGALFANIAGAGTLTQMIIFVVISALLLVFTRPLAIKFVRPPFQKTNADRSIGKQAVVVEAIDNLNAKGQVKVDGSIWTARNETNEPLPEGALVRVIRIEGVKLIVSAETVE